MFKLNSPCISTFEYKGVFYNIDLSFDNVLNVIDILDDESRSPASKALSSVTILLDDADTAAAFTTQELMEFYGALKDELIEKETSKKPVAVDLLGNPMPTPEEDTESEEDSGELFNLTHDATYLYTSFLNAYGIDLHRQLGKLHWHEFMALLRDLPDTTMFGEIVRIRGTKLSDIKDSKERERIKKLKKLYALPKKKGVQ